MFKECVYKFIYVRKYKILFNYENVKLLQINSLECENNFMVMEVMLWNNNELLNILKSQLFYNINIIIIIIKLFYYIWDRF